MNQFLLPPSPTCAIRFVASIIITTFSSHSSTPDEPLLSLSNNKQYKSKTYILYIYTCTQSSIIGRRRRKKRKEIVSLRNWWRGNGWQHKISHPCLYIKLVCVIWIGVSVAGQSAWIVNKKILRSLWRTSHAATYITRSSSTTFSLLLWEKGRKHTQTETKRGEIISKESVWFHRHFHLMNNGRI